MRGRPTWLFFLCLIVAITLALLFVAFVLANRQDVTVDFLFFSLRTPLVWALIGSALAGLLLGLLLPYLGGRARADEQLAALRDEPPSLP